MTQRFSKRFFSPAAYRSSTRSLLGHLGDVRGAARSGRVSRAFMERIMLAVTQVNGCRYCHYAHTRAALAAGVTPAEVEALLRQDTGALPADEVPALLFAQHYAESAGAPDAEAVSHLYEVYGAETARDILTFIRLISFGNLLGNTFDALLARFRGQGAPGSRAWQEAGVLLSVVFALPVRTVGTVIAARLGRARGRARLAKL